MNRILKGILISLLTVSCFGCSQNTTEVTTEEVSMEPAANVDPSEIDPGQRSDNECTSDYWYNSEDEYIYFTYANNDSGLSVTWMKNGKEIYSSANTKIKDKELKSEDSNQFDFQFYDIYNVYDTVSKTWFSRGNLEETQALFNETTLKKDDSNILVFHEDNNVDETYKGNETTGTWKIINGTQIEYTPDEENIGYRFDFYVNDDGSLDSIQSSAMGTYTVS